MMDTCSSGELLRLLVRVSEIARKKADGHFTIMHFTTNFKVILGTPDLNDNQCVTGLELGTDEPIGREKVLLDKIVGHRGLADALEDFLVRHTP